MEVAKNCGFVKDFGPSGLSSGRTGSETGTVALRVHCAPADREQHATCLRRRHWPSSMRSARIVASVCGEVCATPRALGIRALGAWLLKRGERWAERGQLALEQGHVCVLNATALATEVLKNLTLPGIGHFTLVDKQRITGAPPRVRACAVGVAAARCRVCVRKLRALALRVHTVPTASGTPDFLRPASSQSKTSARTFLLRSRASGNLAARW
jgi:hypothetical protein